LHRQSEQLEARLKEQGEQLEEQSKQLEARLKEQGEQLEEQSKQLEARLKEQSEQFEKKFKQISECHKVTACTLLASFAFMGNTTLSSQYTCCVQF